jgi:hypothetical protein
LVSAKHFAHSGRAVGVHDELDLSDRLRRFEADRFVGVYSTVPSSGLTEKLTQLGIRFAMYDRGRISSALLEDTRLDRVFESYFPQSYRRARSQIDEGRLRLFTELGFPPTQRVEVDLPEALDKSAQGGLTIADPDIEDVMIACVIADALIRERFTILRYFASLRPVVWRTLTTLLDQSRFDRRALAQEILRAGDATSLRLLVAIAGALRAEDTVEPICRRLLSDGRRRAKEIAELHLVISPLYDVIGQSLASMPRKSGSTLAFYREQARARRLWREKKLLESALRDVEQRE